MKTRFPRKLRRRWLLVLVPVLAAGAWYTLGAVTYATSLRLYTIPSGSMSPTLAPGDKVCAELAPRTPPKRGEIWIFNSPTGSAFVKRVIGLPGETVAVAGGKVTINGRPLDEPYLSGTPSYTMPPIQLAADEYIMLGDSRNASNDSHVLGPVPARELIGRALYRYWPTTRLGGLK